jgi:hypothetical protein
VSVADGIDVAQVIDEHSCDATGRGQVRSVERFDHPVADTVDVAGCSAAHQRSRQLADREAPWCGGEVVQQLAVATGDAVVASELGVGDGDEAG